MGGNNKHVTTACLNCRRRKIKCDGNKTCSNCVTYELPCVYNAEGDMRKASTKTAIEKLERRVLQLESLLQQQSNQQPDQQDTVSVSDAGAPLTKELVTTSSQRARQHSMTTDMAQTPSIQGQLPSNSENASPSVNGGVSQETAIASAEEEPPLASPHGDVPILPALDDFEFLPQDDTEEIVQDIQPLDLHPANGTRSDISPQQVQLTIDHSTSGREDTGSDLEDILSARMGLLRLSEDGQLRYYGPTSNLNIQNNGTHALSRSTIRDVSAEGNNVLRKLGLDHPVSLTLETHLAKLYFSWEDPAIHVVDEEAFFREKEKYLSGTNSPYYSETLNNAICAMGACLAAGEQLDVPEPAAEFFSMRAKAFLDIEMDSPTVATVQALVVMSASEAAFTRDARGWLYSGMAVRLCVDLGLHMDVTEHRMSGLLTQDDIDIRRTTFWGVFIHEHMWSLYVGRPWNMGIQNITVARPAENLLSSLVPGVWKPYPRAAGLSSIPDDGVPFALEVCTTANIGLCEFMKRINATLYSGCMMGLDALIAFLSQTEADLMAWHAGLPPLLQVDPLSVEKLYPPAVLQLRMQYNSTLISLYRPYLSKRLSQDGRHLLLPANQSILDRVAKSCVWAAHDIAESLRYHQRQHSLQKTNIQIVHIIFTASLIFIYDVCTRPYHESRVSLGDLQLCCRALGEIGHCYGNATRALEVIILVKSEWQKLATAARHRPSMSLKRPSVQISASSAQEEQDNDHETHARPRQRARSSAVATESQTPPTFFMPPSYHSYDNLLNNQAGFNASVNHPSISNTQAFQDLWLLPQEGDFDIEEIPSLMDWFNTEEVAIDPIQSPDRVPGEGQSDRHTRGHENEG